MTTRLKGIEWEGDAVMEDTWSCAGIEEVSELSLSTEGCGSVVE